ncbi:uncharacterized protein LOC106153228 [Lingula anatina]|uniref:Uncharacterized protein LOC106153228 n=1 Tax=Lingula anatina TaxID=7574 RepID=A0A1S3H945_LINAN|nr:uncharacterized protein LOC106153228 [Lingula anatina]|eukprot:XP_013382533.2 uncharacterized protein LOC106153228 [Lingula anatina]
MHIRAGPIALVIPSSIMKFLVVVPLLLAFGDLAYGIVCMPEMCKNVEPLDATQCKGGVITRGGYCGCNDACAKVEGETCQAPNGFLGPSMNLGRCDNGLECVQQANAMRGVGKCTMLLLSKREGELTKCQQEYRIRQISMVIWQGMRIPKCDKDGLYETEQCNNLNECYCVDKVNGVEIEGTKALGAAKC